MPLPAGLLDAAKNYLDITWADADGDVKLSGILARGIAYLNRSAGAELDYSVEGQARALLLDYARYVRSGALDEFMRNYLHELIALQMEQGGVEADTESDENTDV